MHQIVNVCETPFKESRLNHPRINRFLLNKLYRFTRNWKLNLPKKKHKSDVFALDSMVGKEEERKWKWNKSIIDDE